MKKYIALVMTLILALGILTVSNASGTYQAGDIMNDFTIVTHDGKSISLYETLKSKELVMINIWASWCGPCRSEFPYMEEVYKEYSDRVEIIAVSCDANDTKKTIGEFAKDLGLTFPMGQDTANLAYLFNAQYIPTTALISKTGRIEFVESSAMSSTDDFRNLFEAFLQKHPSVAPSDQTQLMQALNEPDGKIEFYNSTDEYAWPMTIAPKDGRDAVMASNTGVGNSYASLKGRTSANIGDVLVVEFKTSTEPMFDLMKICIDNTVVKVFGGEHDWMTYAHPFGYSGEHQIEITYVKNMGESAGSDCIWIDTIKVVPAAEALEALSLNPEYPVHDRMTLEIASPNSKKVLIFDPSGTLEYYFGEFEAYVLNGSQAEIKLGITNQIDPEITCIVSDYDGSGHAISAIEPDEDGYYRLTLGCDSMNETGYPYSTVYFYSDPALDPEKTVMYFMDEENLDAMMALASQDEENPAVWTYEQDIEDGLEGEEVYDYTEKVTDQNGYGVAGAMLQVCDDTVCSVYETDENGQSAFSLLPGIWEMHVLMLPDGYEMDEDNVIALADGGEDIEITVIKK
ncbi:MAG: redoxin domain-containing protein [Clostridia bacterium]|nr:redoxin domain-containing protein [Clostridia bacterium]